MGHSTPKKESFHKKGLSLQRLGRQEEAITFFDMAIELDPSDLEVLYDRAVSLQMSMKFDDAISSFDKVLESDPENFAALVNKGLCLANPEVQRQEEALLCFEDALRISPNDPGVLSLKGYTLDALGRFREAIMCFDVVLQKHPDDTNVSVNKGLSLMHLGRYDEAVAYFDRVLEDEPGNLFALEWKKDAEKMRDRDLLS
ncbi:MAG TPA: tetratricopeptide repeat protein [Candidatus Nitrosotalea sp.]|nr:tetratricopeptide repeat protein [Candidatus Nitrosotalea sp.]